MPDQDKVFDWLVSNVLILSLLNLAAMEGHRERAR